MPRDTIRRLSHHVDQLLVAGAHLAIGNAELAADKTALDLLSAKLGAKAPAITAIAVATAKALTAKPADAARELVGLATMAGQIRAAQAQPAPVPATKPLERRVPIGTPCNAKNLSTIRAALTTRMKGRWEAIQLAIDSGDIVDLRLVDAVIHAMADAHLGVLVVDNVVPLLGPAMVTPLRASLAQADLAKGRAIDGRRLRALIAVQRGHAADLVQVALQTGPAALREAVFEAIVRHAPGDEMFESLILASLENERSGNVRRAAVQGLTGSASEAALDALIDGLDDPSIAPWASGALRDSPHSAIVDRLLERLATLVSGSIQTKRPNKKRTGGITGNPTEPSNKSTGNTDHRIQQTLSALAKHRNPRIADAAMPLLHFGAAAAEAVLTSGTPAQQATVATFLTSPDFELRRIAARALATLDPESAFTGLSAPFAAADAASLDGQFRMNAAIREIATHPDPRWRDWALNHLTRVVGSADMSQADAEVLERVIQVLATWGDQRAVAPIITLIGRTRYRRLTTIAIDALGKLGNPTAIDAILAQQSDRHGFLRWQTLQEAILAINHPSAVVKLRAIIADQKDWWRDQGYPDRLLDQLERRFPGV